MWRNFLLFAIVVFGCLTLSVRTVWSDAGLSLAVNPNNAASPLKTEESRHIDRSVALTFDDLPYNGPSLSLKQMQEVNSLLTEKLSKMKVPAIGFVNEKKIVSRPDEIGQRTNLLNIWLSHGLMLGNHTYSHMNLEKNSTKDFEDDVVKGETISAGLLRKRGLKLHYFRFPYLSMGRDASSKAEVCSFLKQRGYDIVPVSISADDWMFAAVYTRARLQGDYALMKQVVKSYLQYTKDVLLQVEKSRSSEAGGAPKLPAQIMLLHCNYLNADHLQELIGLLKSFGYRFVSVPEALEEPCWKNDYGQGVPSNPNAIAPPKFIQELYKSAHYDD
jgi:peptidoglycan/xylan/chitin deacetylase (PgdA/CDA1 family)